MATDLDKAFQKLDKLNPDATYLSESGLSTVEDYVDTGCMVLNSIISGSLYGGVPKGRITGFSGPSMTGKTYIINKILGNAQITVNPISFSEKLYKTVYSVLVRELNF